MAESENDITIILADDHELLRDGFTSVFQQPGIKVLATAKNGEELLQLVKQYQPQIVVTDIRMPVMDGIAATAIIKKEFPGIRVLSLTGYEEVALIEDMKEAGADGFAMKGAENEELLHGIKTISRGKAFYCTETARLLLKLQMEPPTPGVYLTPREVEVMKLVSKGLSNKEMARELRIKTRTVESHKANIYKKTGTNTPVSLALFCRRWEAHREVAIEE